MPELELPDEVTLTAAINTAASLDPVKEPAEAAPAAEESATNEPTVATAADDALVTVTDAEGAEKQISVAELKKNNMFQQDYTKKTQATSERNKVVEARERQLEDREAALVALLQDKDKLIQLAAAKVPGAEPAPQLADDDVLTMGVLRQELMAFGQQVNQSIQAGQAQTSDAIFIKEAEEVLQNAVEAVVQEYPLLNEIPNIRDTLRGLAAAEKPADLASMHATVVAAGKQLGAKLSPASAKQPVEKAASVDKRLTAGIEPPGGATPPPDTASPRRASSTP